VPYEEMTTMRKSSKVRRGVSSLSKRRGDVSKGDSVMVQQWTPSDRVMIKVGELEGWVNLARVRMTDRLAEIIEYERETYAIQKWEAEEAARNSRSGWNVEVYGVGDEPVRIMVMVSADTVSYSAHTLPFHVSVEPESGQQVKAVVVSGYDGREIYAEVRYRGRIMAGISLIGERATGSVVYTLR